MGDQVSASDTTAAVAGLRTCPDRRPRRQCAHSALSPLHFTAPISKLVRAHPGLPTSQHPMGQLRQRLQAIAKDLHRWEAKLARGLPEKLKRGEFRRDEAGLIWKTEAKARAGAGSALRGAPTHGPPAEHRRGREPPGAQAGQRCVRGNHERAQTGGGAGRRNRPE
eukprot:scaffold122104_cov30-Phaeocystis_antarctica.AAC.1